MSLLVKSFDVEGGVIWENGIETCMLSYVKRITSPEGWDGEGGEGGSEWGTHVHMYTCGGSMSMYGRAATIL